jgi:alpha/beta hydrolase fold
VRSTVASVSSRKRSASSRSPAGDPSRFAPPTSVPTPFHNFPKPLQPNPPRQDRSDATVASPARRVTEAPSCRSPRPPGNPSIRVVHPPVDQDRETLDDVLVGGAVLGGAPLDEVEVDQMAERGGHSGWDELGTGQIISSDGQTVKLVVVRPAGVPGPLPAFMFFHGGGWVLGDSATHERLVRDLVAGSSATAAFVEYDRSPEAHWPAAINRQPGGSLPMARRSASMGGDWRSLATVSAGTWRPSSP